MATYEDAKAKSYLRATTTTLIGVPLEVSDDHPLRQAQSVPIQVCGCSTGACGCGDSPVVWVDKSAIRSRSATGRRNDAGDDLHEFAVAAEASVMVETCRRVKVSEIGRMSEPASTRGMNVPPFIARRRRDATAKTYADVEVEIGPATIEPDHTDYEIVGGHVYCYVESSAHYHIYVLC
jgi:hypothetical protein